MVIVPPPNLKDAIKASHKNLIRVLRHCPLSRLFATNINQLNCMLMPKKAALNEVLKIVMHAEGLMKMPEIEELNAADE